MNLQKINNFALKLALALGFAGASALSSLSVVQAQTPPYPTGISQGYQQRYVAQQQYYRQRYQYPMRQRQQQRYYYPPPQGQQRQYVVPQQRRPPKNIVAPPTNLGTNTPFMLGVEAGQEDGLTQEEFRPCLHMEYINGDKRVRRAFIQGYSQGYFSVNP